MPINKNIWTISFAVFMGGVSTLAFTCFYWLVDVHGIRGWTKPWVTFGMNSIIVYMFAGFLESGLAEFHFVPFGGEWISFKRLMGEHFLGSFLSGYNVSLVYALMIVGMSYALAWWMHQRKIYVKV
jgi:predicted acyltransferase